MRSAVGVVAITILMLSVTASTRAGLPASSGARTSGAARTTAGDNSGVDYSAMAVNPLGAGKRAASRTSSATSAADRSSRSRMDLDPDEEDVVADELPAPPTRRMRNIPQSKSDPFAEESSQEPVASELPRPRRKAPVRPVSADEELETPRHSAVRHAAAEEELPVEKTPRRPVRRARHEEPATQEEPTYHENTAVRKNAAAREEAAASESKLAAPARRSSTDDADPRNYWKTRRVASEPKLVSPANSRQRAAQIREAEERILAQDAEEHRADGIIEAGHRETGSPRHLTEIPADSPEPRPGKQTFRMANGKAAQYEYKSAAPGVQQQAGNQPATSSRTAKPATAQQAAPKQATAQQAAPKKLTFKERWQRFWSFGRAS